MRFNRSDYSDAFPIVGNEVENYLYAILPERGEVLRQMESEAGKRGIPIVGPVVGRLFHQLATMIRAKSVFELGSAIGYSTLWWADAVGVNGKVTYTDSDRKNADEAKGYFQRAKLVDRIVTRTGDALELLSEEQTDYDIIFCDVDKEDYPRAFRLARNRIRQGGLFICDNVLWSGRVAYSAGNPQIKANPSESTQAVAELNRMLYASPDFYTTIIPIRDGVSVSMKL